MRTILRARCTLRSPHPCLLDNLTRPFREWIDALPGGCDHETSFPFRVCWRGTMLEREICAQRHDRSHCQIVFLGRARINADGGPGDVALRREYALSGADRAGRDAIHTGLRHGAAYAGKPLDRAERRAGSRNAHFCDALSLGSHPGDTVFLSAVRRKERISFLQLSIKISGTRQPEASL